MGDPELSSDENVLVRTPGIYVKSIPFEGILTNKRIILIDRAKNLLPPREIPLVTINEVESGENAIRDQIITLSVTAKTGETRQMVLTFSRQAGGNRIKERDVWERIIKENATPSSDQVIRNVIAGLEPAPRRAEPAAGPRYEVVHARPQQTAPSGEYRPAGSATDDISPVRRSIVTSPATVTPPSPAVLQADVPPPGTSLFCSKCGNKIPAESVFCNRCGSPVARIPPMASAPVQTPPAPPFVRTPAARPIDEEIQSVEPLIIPSTEKIPADALRAAPAKAPQRTSESWDTGEEPAPAALPVAQAPGAKPAEKGVAPQAPRAKSTGAAAPAPGPSPHGAGDTPLPPKPPRKRSFMPGKRTVLTAAVVAVAIVLVAIVALVVYPMLTSGGSTTPSGSGNATPPPVSSTITPSGTIVVKETQAPQIPPTGIYVHINYMGGFKGIYGIPDSITTVPGNSGDRVWEVENATNSTVQATFEKLDGSTHQLLVEIYKNGKVLTSGTTTVGHGSVALSVDMITGKAATPVTSGQSGTATKTMVAVTTAAVAKTTAPPAKTTTVSTNTTSAAS